MTNPLRALLILLFLSTSLSTFAKGMDAIVRTEGFFYQQPSSEALVDVHLIQNERVDKNTQIQSDLQINHWQGNKAHRTYFYPQKFVISSKVRNTTLYLGTKELELSHIDFLSPLQFYQTYDLTHPLRAQAFNPLLFGTKTKFSKVSFEAYYMPVRKPSMLPHEKSPWLPQKVYTDESSILYLPDEVRYSIGKRESANHADINNLLLSTTFNMNDDMDWRVLYYNGISSFPEMTPRVTGTIIQTANPTIARVNPDVTLNILDTRTESWGSSFQWALGKNILRLENAWNRRYYSSGVREEQENAVQLERMISFFSYGQGVVQVAYLWNNDDSINSPSLFSLRQAINRSVLIGTKLNWKEKHDLTAYYLGSTLSSRNNFYGVQYKYSALNNLNLWGGWQGISGREGQSLFYAYKDMSNFNVGLEITL